MFCNRDAEPIWFEPNRSSVQRRLRLACQCIRASAFRNRIRDSSHNQSRGIGRPREGRYCIGFRVVLAASQ